MFSRLISSLCIVWGVEKRVMVDYVIQPTEPCRTDIRGLQGVDFFKDEHIHPLK